MLFFMKYDSAETQCEMLSNEQNVQASVATMLNSSSEVPNTNNLAYILHLNCYI